jgi:hypothetical protein
MRWIKTKGVNVLDRDLIGGIGGGLASIVMEGIPLLVGNVLRIPVLTHSQMCLYMFTKSLYPLTLFDWVTGVLSHLIVGGIAGFIFVNYLRNHDRNHLVLKAVLWGAVLWFLAYGFICHVLLSIPEPTNGLIAFIALIEHIVFGLVLGLFVQRFQDRLR